MTWPPRALTWPQRTWHSATTCRRCDVVPPLEGCPGRRTGHRTGRRPRCRTRCYPFSAAVTVAAPSPLGGAADDAPGRSARVPLQDLGAASGPLAVSSLRSRSHGPERAGDAGAGVRRAAAVCACPPRRSFCCRCRGDVTHVAHLVPAASMRR